MHEPPDSTPQLLRRWHQGEAAALDALVSRHLPWLREHVQRRLGGFLRSRAEAGDYLQDVLVEFLRDGPRFQVRDEEQFRRLLARVAENTLRDKNDWFRAKRRRFGDAGLPNDSVLDLQTGAVTSSTPSRLVAREETRAWVRLALELLGPEERKLILARDYDDRSFADIGAELGMSADAARMRWVRAVAELGRTLTRLRRGVVDGGEPTP